MKCPHDICDLNNGKKGPLAIFRHGLFLLLLISEAWSPRWHFQVTSAHCLCLSIPNSDSLPHSTCTFWRQKLYSLPYRTSCCHAGLELCLLRMWREFEHMKIAWPVSLRFRNYFKYYWEWEIKGLRIEHSWAVCYWKGFILLWKFNINCFALSSGSRFVLIECCQGNNACGFSRCFRRE